ncbi:MAG TPA: universal stress protein [Candidatus Limosilactobacillus faecipullorum]|nr:universal stress protein [Candidatus Limosilactobacillus faecipullorum]
MISNSYRNILVPIDGSKATPKVMETAIKVALLNDAHLDILNVAQVNQIADGYADILALSEDQTLDLVELVTERLKDLKNEALKAGVKSVDIHIRFGNPKQIIARDFPQDHHPDLIVMGRTGLTALERVLVGSVTAYVERFAPCDVLTIQI